MKRAVRIWFGIVLAFAGAGGIVGAFLPGGPASGRVGSAVLGVLLLFFALRTWARTGDARER